jgi:hypothetical protein
MIPFPKSLLGTILAAAYFLFAVWVAYDDYKSTGGGWLNVRGLPTILVTFPVSFIASWLRKALGIDPGGFTAPLKSDFPTVLMFSLFILLCTLLVYLFGAGVETIIRKLGLRAR